MSALSWFWNLTLASGCACGVHSRLLLSPVLSAEDCAAGCVQGAALDDCSHQRVARHRIVSTPWTGHGRSCTAPDKVLAGGGVRVVHPRPLLQDLRQNLGAVHSGAISARLTAASDAHRMCTTERSEGLSSTQDSLDRGCRVQQYTDQCPILQPRSLDRVQQQCILVCSGTLTGAGRC